MTPAELATTASKQSPAFDSSAPLVPATLG
jgi:hypothetical protein